MKLCVADNVTNVLFDDERAECVRLKFVDDQAVMECSLVEDASTFEELFEFDGDIVSVRHTLTLVADRNMAEAWLESTFSRESGRVGLCALVTLNDGRRLLVGYSERFGAQQPLRVKQIASGSGSKRIDIPRLTMTLESFDTSAAAICRI